MANARKLYVLTELRNARGITLEQMAQACGLVGKRSRESVADWERGKSIPHIRKRPKIIEYLGQTLGLRYDSTQFQAVWDVFVEEWNWEPLSTSEWQHAVLHTRMLGLAKPPMVSSPPLPPRIAPKSWPRAEWPAVTTTIPQPAPLPPGSRMPFSHNPLFVGRGDDLTALTATLNNAPSAAPMTVVIAATGMGGIGKTQLATEFVHRYGRFFAGGVFWLSFADPHAVPAEIAACGSSGHLALESNYESLALGEQVKLVLEEWSKPLPRLLIFDNCEDPELLERWRPKHGGSRVLLTSRRAQWNTQLAVQTLLLGVLSRRESIELLQNHCPDLALDDVDLIAIAAELEDLPLALHLAGRFLALYRADVTPAAYVRQLRAPNILSHPSLRSDGNSPTGHDQHVARTFAFSYERLNISVPIDRAARALLTRAAHFAPGEPIPSDLLLATLDTKAADATVLASAALARLVDLGLIEVAGRAGEFVRMHRLIVAFVRQIDDDPQAQPAVEHVLLATAARLNRLDAQMQLLALQPHLRAATHTTHRREDEQTAALCFELSQHLLQIEDYDGALHYNQRSLDIRTAELGEHHPGITTNLHHMGWILDWQTLDAKPYHERALDIRRAALGDNHPDTAESFNYMGTVLHARCAYTEARHYYEQALAIRERVLGETHSETAQSLNNLGLLTHAQGYYQEARRYHERALAIRDNLPQPNYAKLAITLNNLGYLLRAMGHYSEAHAHLERALQLREQVFGPNNSYIAVTLSHLGRLAHYRGDYRQAWAYLERAITIRTQVLQPNHPDIANNLDNFGMILYDQGDYAGAESYLERAFAILAQVWGPRHRHTARNLNHLGLLLHAQGDLAGARAHLEEAWRIRTAILGPNHPDTANSVGHLGVVLLDQGDPAAAQPYLARALAIHHEMLGNEHPYTARSLDQLSRCLQARGHDQSARRHRELALRIYRQILGTEHPYTVAVMRRDDQTTR
jgi:tetratricopeptide (TPR) repeat protein/transcriptional regulator with XRE-family HTH domain